MRQRIDITEMEARTKIRAKYLRALENEEWDLLPGPTYVKSFLRTYADALGLESRAVVEEYKLRHEGLMTGELHPIRPPTPREQRRRASAGRDRRGLPAAAVLGLLLALVVLALFIVGKGAEDDDDQGMITPTTATTPPEEPREEPKPQKPPRKTRVRVQLIPTAPVSVCLVDAKGRVLIGNVILQPGQPSARFRGRRFRLVLGNNSVDLKINGTSREVPASSGPIAYEITPKGRKDLPARRRPTCEPS
jgi:hypothetical protein